MAEKTKTEHSKILKIMSISRQMSCMLNYNYIRMKLQTLFTLLSGFVQIQQNVYPKCTAVLLCSALSP